MTIYDMYIRLNGKSSVLNGDDISKQRLQAILVRIKHFSETHGSNKIDGKIEEHVKRFELSPEHLSEIENDLNAIDANVSKCLSEVSISSSNNDTNYRRGGVAMSKAKKVEIAFAIITIAVSLLAIVFLVFGIIDEINYDMLAFYITLGGAVASLIGALISRGVDKKGKRRKIIDSGKRNKESKIVIKDKGSDIIDSFNDNENCDIRF